MIENEKNVPIRRFKEFENAGDWEQSIIGKTGYFYYGKSAPKWSVTKDSKTPCVRYGELYTKHTEKIDRIYSYTNIPRENLKFSTGKEVLVPRVGEDPLDFANCSWLSISDVAIGEMISVYNTEQNPLFMAYMFNALLKYEFAKRVEGGNVSNLYYVYLEDIPVSLPSIDEQEKITTFLTNISNLITFHQRKLEKMKALKKAYLMEMFPAEGECKPKLRFAGFDDDWEQCKFEDIVKDLSGGTSIKPSDYQEEGIRTIPKGAVNSTGVADLSGSKYVSVDFFERNISSKVEADNLVTSLRDLVPTAPNMGRIVQIIGEKEKFLMPQGVYRIILCDMIDEDFVVAYSNSERYRSIISREKNGSTQVHIRNGEFLDIEIYTPSYFEQKKIGLLLSKIDNLITLYQHKLDKLQNIKKAYLNEMFI